MKEILIVRITIQERVIHKKAMLKASPLQWRYKEKNYKTPKYKKVRKIIVR